MLENKNLTELDNDFITVWSHLIVYREIDYEKIYIERLAELGQINAIQSYYLIKDSDEGNKVIDERVEKLNPNSFNNSLAKAHYYEAIEEKTYLEENQRELNKLIDFRKENFYALMKIGRLHEIDSQIEELLSDRDKTKYGKNLRSALRQVFGYFESTRNILTYQRYLEIYLGNAKRFGELEHIHKDAKHCRKLLMKDFKKSPCDAVKYALGKNLVFFGNDKQKALGMAFLTELANRELSQTLLSHISKKENRYNVNEKKNNVNKEKEDKDSFDEIFAGPISAE